MAPDLHPSERPVAVFDSGVGGLTVLHELLVALPNEDFLYLGDTARFPYGDRTVEYVALILLLALVFAAVVKFGAGKDFDIGKTIVGKLKDAIDGVGDPPK